MTVSRWCRHAMGPLAAACVAYAALPVTGCGGTDESSESNVRSDLLVATVKRQDVIVEVSATGVVEPIRVIEIKSKASGEIIAMPVETGDVVPRGALLARVDTTDVAIELRQRTADVATRRAEATIADRQLERSRDLYRRGMISQDEYDHATLGATTARSSLIRAETELGRAREGFSDTNIRAPSAGTILSKSVEQGQIIASATREVSGGTTLLKMADLTRVQVRALIDETDIGKVSAGQRATVRVDAFPDRRFAGEILKIEPEGVEERDITFFPVLIHIDNADYVLRPGMNGTLDIHIDRRDNTLALTNDAVKTVQQAMQIAPMLGIEPDTIRALIGAPPRRRPGGPGTSDGASGERFRPPREGRSGRGGGPGMRRFPRPEGGFTPPPGASGTTNGKAVVFISDSSGVRAEVIGTGIQNWNVTEVLRGLGEGDEVMIPPSPLIAQQFEQFRERMKRWSSLPGQR